jgi:hypothetical protein
MILTELPPEILEKITSNLDDNIKILLRKVCITFYQAYYLKSAYFNNIPVFLIIPSIMKTSPVSFILNQLCSYCPIYASYQHQYYATLDDKPLINYECYFHNSVHGNHNFSVPINGYFHLYGIFTKYHNIIKKIIKTNPIFKENKLQFNYWYETPYCTVSLFGCNELIKLTPLPQLIRMQLNEKKGKLAIIEIPVVYQNVKYLIYQLKKEKDIKKCCYPKLSVSWVY